MKRTLSLPGRQVGPQGTVPERPDRIVIDGLRCMVHVGVPDAERRPRQRLLLDITLETPLARAGKQDDMRATVDYAAAAALAKKITEERSYKLVEAIAERVVAALLTRFRTVTAVSVGIRKFSVPHAESVGVEITRSQR